MFWKAYSSNFWWSISTLFEIAKLFSSYLNLPLHSCNTIPLELPTSALYTWLILAVLFTTCFFYLIIVLSYSILVVMLKVLLSSSTLLYLRPSSAYHIYLALTSRLLVFDYKILVCNGPLNPINIVGGEKYRHVNKFKNLFSH